MCVWMYGSVCVGVFVGVCVCVGVGGGRCACGGACEYARFDGCMCVGECGCMCLCVCVFVYVGGRVDVWVCVGVV